MPDLLTPLLRTPSQALDLDERTWDLVLRQARAANLLARLAAALQADLPHVPTRPRAHLEAALVLAAHQRIAIAAEVQRIAQALQEVDLSLILLKGAAYALADLPCAQGRLFGDIDILVPQARLADAESALLRHGWVAAPMSSYDQFYYRQWMHEIPPLIHSQRGSTLDVHHNLLPLTHRHPPDAGLLIAQTQKISAASHDIRTLSPVDMVLHSASHLLHESEFPNGLRDLADLDDLLRHFGQDAHFWPQLRSRALALHWSNVLAVALALCQDRLGTPIPDHAPLSFRQRVLTGLWQAALSPQHVSASSWRGRLARTALFLRGHCLRMPLLRLGLHLARKTWMRLTRHLGRQAN